MKKSSLCLIMVAIIALVVSIPSSHGIVTHCPLCGANGAPPGDRPYDLNGDFVVDVMDFSQFAMHYSCCVGQACYWVCCDYDGDGCIDIVDFSMFATHYLHQGPHLCICT